MSENKTKDLIKKSIIITSDDFTDKLMHRLEAKQEVERTMVWAFKTVFWVLAIVMLIVSYVLYKYLNPTFSLLNIEIGISKTLIFLIISILFLFSFNNIIRLNDTQKGLKNDV